MAAPQALVIAAVSQRERLAKALLWGLLAALGLLALVVSPLLVLSEGGGGPAGRVPPGSPIPPALVPIYVEAQRAYQVNWLLLASVHMQESSFSRSPDTFQINGSGCAGPMQISYVPGSACGCEWCDPQVRNAYRRGRRPLSYPHPVRPHPSVYDNFDAIMAGAVILRQKVGGRAIPRLDGTARSALCGYYGACADRSADYANVVLGRAQAWERALRRSGGLGISPPRRSGGLIWPVRGPITSRFCERRSWEACHPGIDIGVPTGTPIHAAATGRVTNRGPAGGYGLYTCLDHGRGYSTCYAHQLRSTVVPGQFVAQGQVIGLVDCSGLCFGAHLHFEVRIHGQVTDPMRYLPR